MITNRTAFVFANGTRANLSVLRSLIKPGDFLVAADGGLRFARALGLRPDLVIGDLDSLAPEERQQLAAEGVNVQQFPVDKDETDLELALQAVIDAGCQQVRIVGALGGRLDMTLANIFLLMLPALSTLDVRLEDGYDEVFLVRPDAPAAVTGQVGERVSLLPLNGPAHGVRTQGLEYPLHGETLWPERTRGVSNRILHLPASVTLEAGLLLCIHTHHTPPPSEFDQAMEENE